MLAQNKIYCQNKRCKNYIKYGKRGIKLLMTQSDFKKLWLRDKAFDMVKPIIHRWNNDGHYEVNNCSFLPRSLHIGIHNRLRPLLKNMFAMKNKMLYNAIK